MKILMVCLGNICRSPLAHGILQHKANEAGLEWEIDSAGTNGYHNGEKPDPRSVSIAGIYGIDITYQNSRQITVEDLDYYDIIYVMDTSNYNNVMTMCTSDSQKDKVKLILNEITPGANEAVPDPYYGGDKGFENVYKMLDEACEFIIKKA